MSDYLNIVVASRPQVVSETETNGVYEISGLYPGYGNTLGNALRRMLLSSIPGSTITNVNIKDVPHEFSTIDGVKEDVLTIIINLKEIKIKSYSQESPQKITLKKKGKGKITAGDFEVPSQIEIVNKDLVIAEITDDKASIDLEATVDSGIGFRAREDFENTSEAGVIYFDSVFSPVKRSSYEVSNMILGDRTDFNKLKILVETDGTVSPHKALDIAINTMIKQLSAMVTFQQDDKDVIKKIEKETSESIGGVTVEDLELGAAVTNSLEKVGINTIDDILKKGISDIKDIPGVGEKAIADIASALEKKGIVFKDN